MSNTIEIVINDCYGGFSISPEAALWMYAKGCKSLAIPVDKYFSHHKEDDAYGKKAALAAWNSFLTTKELKGFYVTVFSPDEQYVLDTRSVERTDPILIQCVKELGAKANGTCAKLKIIEIPAGISYEIDDYDGMESVEESHRSWN